MGGLAFADRGFTRGKSIIVSLAGPLVEIVFGLVVWELMRRGMNGPKQVNFFLNQFAFISVFWGLINLVPIYPLDGGHIMVHVLGPRLIKLSIGISVVFAIGIGIFLLLGGNYFGGLVLGYIAFENIKRLRGQTPNSFRQP
jgi:Zn-dependent protease